MNEVKQKLVSVGLCAALLLGACGPITAMAAQKDMSTTQVPISDTSQSSGTGSQDEKAASQSGQTSDPAGSSQTADTNKQEESSESADENDELQQSQLAAQAKITEAEAIAAAQAAYPGGTVTVKELDSEKGAVVYELKVQPADGSKAAEVIVDAVSGQVLENQVED